MAARHDSKWSQEARDKIKTVLLVKRLNAHALSELDEQTGKPVTLEPSRIKAIEILLKKTMPDLQSIEGTLDLTLRKHEDALNTLE